MASLEDAVTNVTEGVASISTSDAETPDAAAAAAAQKKRDKKKRAKANKKAASGGGAAAEDGADAGGGEGGGADGEASSSNLVGKKASELTREEQFELITGRKAPTKGAGGGEGGGKPIKDHAFWDTQPVPKEGTLVVDTGPLVKQTKEEIRQEPYPMAAGMDWALVDVNQKEQCDEVYDLLTNNYVEDDDAMFRFDYSVPFLLWALTPPGFLPELHLGVRSAKSNKLMAFISGVPATMNVHGKKVQMVEINFLCVHKKLRSKRLAPVLIKEITRRVNVNGVFQAVYTAGVVLPSPVAECRYWHRSLNPKKLVEVGFSRIGERMNMARTIKLYKVADKPKSVGMMPMRAEHVKSACTLLNNYLRKFKLAPQLSESEFGHQLLPRPGVIDSFVLVNGKGKVTDLCSFYHLPSSVMKNEKHSKLNAAYSFYNVATTVPLPQLMDDLLVQAKLADMDVFNALDVMDNGSFLSDLKFGIGDGHLQYYLYNYKCPMLESKDVGLVLL